MRYSLLFLFTLFVAGNSQAQNTTQAVINAAGNTFTQNTGTIFEWSVGEIALVETMVTRYAIITNGVLQPVLPSQFITEGFIVKATNILSPNGDGKNDTWEIKDLDRYPDNEVIVFDRAGRVVFKTKNYQNDWTGNFSGVPLAEGTYYYTIKLKKGGKIGQVKGFITIIN
ncbi:gliding motility-associated C-terminal domain-containing protein [Pedobacter africanus]|uniref:Gliding motility-associated C-terminal domain-containing protein n=1 Tax=Pedobacter africanus TaxID=151894 RepID=A0A1W2E5V2_9SPHI|nr:gliding motility-associated C-terminal domain-containing protein [Pedobacter africanus]SMD05159.1 gliding motility-associated C-terminal domain-containing protein [Pedobacter africanus]